MRKAHDHLNLSNQQHHTRMKEPPRRVGQNLLDAQTKEKEGSPVGFVKPVTENIP